MVRVSADVTNPTLKAFIEGDHVVTNEDGSQSVALDAAGTQFAGQEPYQYGVRNDSAGTPGAYQRFTRQGALAIFVCQPPTGDPYMAVYTIVEGRHF